MIKDNSLSPYIINVIRHQATELPNSGEYNVSNNAGTYLCRGCGLALFLSYAKFPSGCGWSSFDEAILNSVDERLDKDGRRVEILCARCQAHLGHVFQGEGITAKNTRYCVNSVSLDFIPTFNLLDTEETILAGGCFWGVEFYLKKLVGILKTEVGYIGGYQDYPSYRQICTGSTGHLEAVRVIYNPAQINYDAVIKYFFEIHDPTQRDGQGVDKGSQYLSAIFYYDDFQKQRAEKIMQLLKQRGFNVATQLLPISIFWPAEIDHQKYYEKMGKIPYCHTYIKRFD